MTEEQIAKLTLVVPDNSPVLCSVCLANDGVPVDWDAGKLPLDQLADFGNCMVVPGPHWSCPRCGTKIKKGRGWGKCPCCRVSGPAQRERWTYIVECQCVLTADQLKAKAQMEESRQRYADPDARREREREAARQVQAEEAKAKAANRAKASACLSKMPRQECTYPETHLPYGDVCLACPRFDRKAAPAQTSRKSTLDQPKVSTPLKDPGSFATRPGFKETIPMRDDVEEAFGDW